MSRERSEEMDATEEHEARGPASVAIVGTLAEFRPDPVPSDLGELVRFVETIGPDLLCLDMTLDQWLRRDFGGLPPEYRDALLPLAAQTDIVVVPIGDRVKTADRGEDDHAAPRVARGWMHDRLRATVAWLQRGAKSPVSVGEGLRHVLVEHLLSLVDRMEGGPRGMAAAHSETLVERIVELARRDSERRILVVVNARHCHQLRRALRAYPEVALVRHSDL